MMAEVKEYLCSICKCNLPIEAFSKKQINKFQHGHSTAVTCISCVSKQEQSGSKNGDNTNAGKVSTEQATDPSLKYISHPLRAPLIKEAKRFYTNHRKLANIPSISEDHIVLMGKTKGWRTLAKMAVRGILHESNEKKDIETKIGLFLPESHDVVEAIDCISHHNNINKVLAIVKTGINQLGINGYVEGQSHDKTFTHQNETYLKYLILALERSSRKIQLSVIWNAEKTNKKASNKLSLLIDHLLNAEKEETKPIFHSIWVNHHVTSQHNNAITGRDRENWVLKHGSEYMEEKIIINPSIPSIFLLPFVFRQANIDAFTEIIKKLREYLPPKQEQARHCLELYGGVGTIGLNCLDLLDVLDCSDENPFNQVCFEKSVATISDTSIASKKVTYHPYSATEMVKRCQVTEYDVIIVDPPRKGLDDEVVNALTGVVNKPSHQDSTDLKVEEQPSALTTPSTTEVGKKRKIVFDEEGEASAVEVNLSNTTKSDVEQVNASREVQKQTLIYVSCGFEAFKRDYQRLTCKRGRAHGEPLRKRGKLEEKNVVESSVEDELSTRPWKLIEIRGYVLFPGSDHIETLAVFQR